MQVYRLRDGIRAVKLESDGHGFFRELGPGCVVMLAGIQTLHGLVEVVCDGERLCIFREDLEIKAERLPEPPANSGESRNS